MGNDLTPAMVEAYKRYAALRDSLGVHGYSNGTTVERRAFTRLLNRAQDLAMAGTGGTEDPVFRRRWAALTNMNE